ncbi:hypothetical protein NEMIN01_0327 [Nematocida minor]|uniref:uncharacterized protein n=1 Tax=Nematocida minor TaxID=1912983 RepID=UPI00221F94D8|nr:uncharacterized protein NEMIN01_0327 [Nematocida minor]KAI5189161.1 hypothetical protein NEMIN01_0327 [Nematocida minor]
MTDANGSIRLIRRGKVDREIEILDREPISMRTYLSLVIESLNKKRDFVLGLVIPAESADDVSHDDNISTEVVGKGMVYLAECINMHRFIVSHNNPNVISVCKKNVVDPNMKCHIKSIYYYALKYLELSELMNSKDKELFKTLSRVLEDSPEAVSELAHSNPVILSSEWIGTENDYHTNSIFHMYLEQNKILGYVFDAKKLCEREIRKEQIIFKSVIGFFLVFVALSFIVHFFTKGVTMLTVLVHIFTAATCILLLFVNACM